MPREVPLSRTQYDVAVVGAGPAGSLAALTLARHGARVILVDKAHQGRDKACGDLIGPRGVRLLDDMEITVPGARVAGDMLVAGPNGRRVLLPAQPGRTYPGHALVVPRARFDALLRTKALDAGAIDRSGRVAAVVGTEVHLDSGQPLTADFVIGADGATSVVAHSTGLVDTTRVLWGFAVRAYLPVEVTLPLIALWNDKRRHGFPGYGWMFPSVEGANLGLGIGLGHHRADAPRAGRQLDAFFHHLIDIGALDATFEAPARILGGWLKMGVVGTRPAAGNVLLVGDAAGLVNPLQGEGIAQALISGHAAAHAVLATPANPATTYQNWVRATYANWTSVTTPVHAALLHHPRIIAAVASTITAPIIGPLIAPTWALYWNNLIQGASPTIAATTARGLHHLARTATSLSRIRRALHQDLTTSIAVEPLRRTRSVSSTGPSSIVHPP
jgi:geranylgeranyl reductase family protein